MGTVLVWASVGAGFTDNLEPQTTHVTKPAPPKLQTTNDQ